MYVSNRACFAGFRKVREVGLVDSSIGMGSIGEAFRFPFSYPWDHSILKPTHPSSTSQRTELTTRNTVESWTRTRDDQHHGVGHVRGTYVQRFPGQDGSSECRGSRPFHQEVRANTFDAAVTSTSKMDKARKTRSWTSCIRMGSETWNVACLHFDIRAVGFYMPDGVSNVRFRCWITRRTISDEDVEEEQVRERDVTSSVC